MRLFSTARGIAAAPKVRHMELKRIRDIGFTDLLELYRPCRRATIHFEDLGMPESGSLGLGKERQGWGTLPARTEVSIELVRTRGSRI